MKTTVSFTLSVLILCIAHVGSASSQTNPLGGGLSELPFMSTAETRMVSPENITGEKGKGAMAVPDPKDPNLAFSHYAVELGQGWKVNPFVKVKAGETKTIMDVVGPGVIQHIWMVVTPEGENWRGYSLRFYWDDETTPSVEVPYSDFFAVGHGKFAPVNSLPVVVNPKSAFNSFWPMPFRKRAKITFSNDTGSDIHLLTYQITYALTPVPDNVGYFHAQWRRAISDPKNPDHTILDGVKGQGRYVGTFLAWTQLSSDWFGEGEVKFFMDGDKKFPTIVGTGLEDYFGGSYGFPETYSTPYFGTTLKPENKNGPPMWSLYRWHLMDPINFQKDLKVTVQALRWWPLQKKYIPEMDDIASVAYWYQREPHAAFPKFPDLKDRWPR